MRKKITLSLISFLVMMFAKVHPCRAQFVIHSSTAIEVAIIGYSGLDQQTLFDGKLTADSNTPVDTSYRGLALLVCEKGEQYPLILDQQPYTLNIKDPATMPSFIGNPENDYFYKRLTAGNTEGIQYEFPELMILAKKLLDSTGSIRTVDELHAMKEKFHDFVRTNYQDMYHSDMLRRLIGQYFMMHEYIDYHLPGAPVTDIKAQYQKAIMAGVRNWLDILKSNIPQHEILNYCVSLYYDRSMVSLALRIMENFRDVAYCPGDEKTTTALPSSFILTDADGDHKALKEVSGKKLVAFVSDDCPISQVVTVTMARRLAQQRDTTLIVTPLQPLSEKHFAMQRMVSGGNMLFVDDEKWRKENIPHRMKLPQFIQIE